MTAHLPFQTLRSPVKTGLFWLGLLAIVTSLAMPVRLLAADDEEAARRLYTRAQKLLAEGDLDEAAEKLDSLTGRHRRSEWCALALWDLARIHEMNGDAEAAFAALDRLVNEQPGHFAKAHAAQFQLVKRQLGLGREERRSLEQPRKAAVTDPERLAEMLRSVIKNGPESETGIQAHFCLGLALEKAGEKKEAVAIYEDFAENHSSHELADDAGFQVARIAYREWKQMRSESPRQREAAAVGLNWFIARFPASDKCAQARSCLAEVTAAERCELTNLARYYDAQGKDKAARIYYRQLALKFPELLRQEGELKEKLMQAVLENEGAAQDVGATAPVVDPQ